MGQAVAGAVLDRELANNERNVPSTHASDGEPRVNGPTQPNFAEGRSRHRLWFNVLAFVSVVGMGVSVLCVIVLGRAWYPLLGGSALLFIALGLLPSRLVDESSSSEQSTD